MSFEKEGHELVTEKELAMLPTYQGMHLLDNSLKELNRKRLLKFMGQRRGQPRFSLTRRGRAVGMLVRQPHARV